MQVVADCNVAVRRGGGRGGERGATGRDGEKDGASRGVDRRGRPASRGRRERGGGRDRNQTSRHRVEGDDGEGSTPVRANDPGAFMCEFRTELRGEMHGKDETKGVP